jgi:hypothetical protein
MSRTLGPARRLSPSESQILTTISWPHQDGIAQMHSSPYIHDGLSKHQLPVYFKTILSLPIPPPDTEIALARLISSHMLPHPYPPPPPLPLCLHLRCHPPVDVSLIPPLPQHAPPLLLMSFTANVVICVIHNRCITNKVQNLSLASAPFIRSWLMSDSIFMTLIFGWQSSALHASISNHPRIQIDENHLRSDFISINQVVIADFENEYFVSDLFRLGCLALDASVSDHRMDETSLESRSDSAPIIRSLRISNIDLFQLLISRKLWFRPPMQAMRRIRNPPLPPSKDSNRR